MLLNVDSSSLKRTPPHFNVESKKPEARVPGKSTVIILEKMGEVVANSQRCTRRSAAPVGNSVGKAILKYFSVVNSLIGAPPMVGHMRVWDDPLCRS